MAIPGVLLAICRLIGLALKSEVVYANTQKAFVIGALAGWVAGRPVIWHLHDILCEEHFSRASTGLVIWLSNRIATRVIANSRATAAAYIAAGGDESRVEVIWNGIDAEPFKRVDLQEIEKFKASLEIGNAPLIGVFGRLAPWKGQHILIEAMQHLPGVHAIVVGEGLYGEAEYARRLRREAKERGVAERVHFLGFSNQVPVLMRSVDVIVHTSTAPEPFGRVIVEGMMAERPVIATSGGGPEEILEAGVSGIIVRPNDPEALAGAVSQLLGPSPSKDLLVARGHARAIERFSLAGMLRHIDRVIDEVLNSSIVRSRQRHVPTGESMNRRGGELR
jgi:glycosyltransferase involved in cell wall biosynthesis